MEKQEMRRVAEEAQDIAIAAERAFYQLFRRVMGGPNGTPRGMARELAKELSAAHDHAARASKRLNAMLARLGEAERKSTNH